MPPKIEASSSPRAAPSWPWASCRIVVHVNREAGPCHAHTISTLWSRPSLILNWVELMAGLPQVPETTPAPPQARGPGVLDAVVGADIQAVVGWVAARGHGVGKGVKGNGQGIGDAVAGLIAGIRAQGPSSLALDDEGNAIRAAGIHAKIHVKNHVKILANIDSAGIPHGAVEVARGLGQDDAVARGKLGRAVERPRNIGESQGLKR